MTADLLLVDVSEIASHPGASQEVAFDVRIGSLQVPMGRVIDDAVHVDLLLEALVEGVLASGTLSGVYELECARCLINFTEPFLVDVAEIYSYPDTEVEPEDGFSIVEGMIDLETMVRDEVLLGVPPHPLHSDECRGLCATCGEDLNQQDCGHERTPVDVRWEPLRALGLAPSEGKSEIAADPAEDG
ncbi:MAG: DUF177 domain-containing protein [Actinomycetota bacterium]